MGVIQFIDEFRELHTKARRGKLEAGERPAYMAAREQFARALLNAQGLMLDGAEARRHYRVAHQLPVELQMAYGNVWTNTLDLSAGGFSVMLPHAVDINERPSALLYLPDGTTLAGLVRVVSQFQRADKHRASFAFLDLTERECELLEGFLIDFALERVGITPP
ncbi:PilZ domain-containing protein [Melittangium boletus]|uniref:Pilus assembly protein PilZ n=1 Tax=Melittangium boletus DSM 14713 TaxID=1294270 RepID=A0A250IDF4_9BACT|nr:PilZ domain-containing protein [Melittangium boletus]ATB29230.1 pilus assembly protein PilZ [Melittangium boletus DSM 14713]